MQIGTAQLAVAALALATVVVIVPVPALKYPPTPPAVAFTRRSDWRTVAHFGMLGFSVLAAVAGVWIRRRLSGRSSAIDAILAGVVGYVALVAALYSFCRRSTRSLQRSPQLCCGYLIASIATQTVLFVVIGIAFEQCDQLGLYERHAVER